MDCSATYRTPDGFSDLVMRSDGKFLTGLHFAGSRKAAGIHSGNEVRDLPVFLETGSWLDVYFGGCQPDFLPPFKLVGLTPFRKAVIDVLLKIPFGETATYGDIAAAVDRRRAGSLAARAVGGAVGWNPLCILIPCHRVIGADRSLTGYSSGMRNKIALLIHEGHALSDFRRGAHG